MAKIETYEAQEDGWTEWIQPIRKGYKMCCCDCGLVHQIDFRVRKGKSQFRVRRDNRSTGQVRRHLSPNADVMASLPTPHPENRDLFFITEVLALLESGCPCDIDSAVGMLNDWRSELAQKQSSKAHEAPTEKL